MGIILQGGTIVTAADTYQADVRLEGEQIAAIGQQIKQSYDEVISVAGCYIFPGGIDPHTHFDLPIGIMRTADDFASGSQAALVGGTTTVVDFATQFRGETLAEALKNWHGLSSGRCYTDYGFHMAITDWSDNIAQEMTALVNDQGVSSFKLYMAYKHVLQVDDSILLAAFQQASKCGALICLHCENGDVIHMLTQQALGREQYAPCYHPAVHPAAFEEEAVRRAIMLAKLGGAPLYVVHLTCQGALEAVAEAKLQGQEVYAETCPQYLLLDDSKYDLPDFEGAKYVISPPLRQSGNLQVLWQGLATGIIDTVATDHCSFNFAGQKTIGLHDFSKIPNGMAGVETRLALLYTYGVLTRKITLNQFVALTSTNAAKLCGLYPRKGTIAVGSDADITVWDPAYDGIITAATQKQQVDYSPFEGFRQRGRAKQVYLRGMQVVADAKLVFDKPQGQYVRRQAYHRGGTDYV